MDFSNNITFKEYLELIKILNVKSIEIDFSGIDGGDFNIFDLSIIYNEYKKLYFIIKNELLEKFLSQDKILQFLYDNVEHNFDGIEGTIIISLIDFTTTLKYEITTRQYEFYTQKFKDIII